MSPEDHTYFMELQMEWIRLREQFFKTKDKAEKIRLRNRRLEIDAEQEKLLEHDKTTGDRAGDSGTGKPL